MDNPYTSRSIADVDGRADNSSTCTNKVDINKKVDNLGTSKETVDANKKTDDLSITTANIDRIVNDLSIGTNIANVDGKGDNFDISIKTNWGTNNLGIGTGNLNVDEQAIASNNACASLFSLHKALFLVFFSVSKIVSASLLFLFNFSLSPMILVK